MNVEKIKECEKILYELSETEIEKEIAMRILLCFTEIRLAVVRIETNRGKCAKKRIKTVKNHLYILLDKSISNKLRKEINNCIGLLM